MASCRRNMSTVQRDGAVQNGEACVDSSPLPKLSHSPAYLALRGFLYSLVNSMSFLMASNRIQAAFAGMLARRSSRPVERSKSKGLHWKRVSFHIFVFFMIGVFLGFTPFLSVDISRNFVSKHRAFSFEEDSAAETGAHQEIDSVREKIQSIDKPQNAVAKWTVKNESLDATSAVPPVPDTDLVPQKLLIIVTPTYVRPFQAYYLNQLAQTLRNVPPPLLWIVVEKSMQSAETAKILRGTGVVYRHLVCEHNATNIKDSGVHQRNVALAHIEKHHLDGIVYFADDDRIYSIGLFDQMRQIRRFGTWPVAMLGESKNKVLLEGPVCNGSEVIGWHTDQRTRISRRFHVDMAGFAFNSTILWDPKRWNRPTLEPIRQRAKIKGFQETTFIEQLVEDESQMEGLANCSEIMVWHLHLEAPELIYPRGWMMQKNLEVVAPLT
ncbi:probable beta-1,4-xylosyltransferase IRX9H [Phoenix dactylifera]|uniref:Glycosyltransferases n=1 Tax=Phoenix dactylifera TaxID=42345 RepID=A0A8B7C0Y5_PHODC|nr:probable beta-1,4-xylosyltransferase IRX9H [Phoenix dactylifera]